MLGSEFRGLAEAVTRTYGDDPWFFLRELAQNSRDAGARSIRVSAETTAPGTETLTFADDGRGMTLAHARRFLFRLYRLGQGRETRRRPARYGIGFWTILRFQPAAIHPAVPPAPRILGRGPGCRPQCPRLQPARLGRPGTTVILTRPAVYSSADEFVPPGGDGAAHLLPLSPAQRPPGHHAAPLVRRQEPDRAHGPSRPAEHVVSQRPGGRGGGTWGKTRGAPLRPRPAGLAGSGAGPDVASADRRRHPRRGRRRPGPGIPAQRQPPGRDLFPQPGRGEQGAGRWCAKKRKRHCAGCWKHRWKRRFPGTGRSGCSDRLLAAWARLRRPGWHWLPPVLLLLVALEIIVPAPVVPRRPARRAFLVQPARRSRVLSRRRGRRPVDAAARRLSPTPRQARTCSGSSSPMPTMSGRGSCASRARSGGRCRRPPLPSGRGMSLRLRAEGREIFLPLAAGHELLPGIAASRWPAAGVGLCHRPGRNDRRAARGGGPGRIPFLPGPARPGAGGRRAVAIHLPFPPRSSCPRNWRAAAGRIPLGSRSRNAWRSPWPWPGKGWNMTPRPRPPPATGARGGETVLAGAGPAHRPRRLRRDQRVAVLLLRKMGVPARLVIGMVGADGTGPPPAARLGRIFRSTAGWSATPPPSAPAALPPAAEFRRVPPRTSPTPEDAAPVPGRSILVPVLLILLAALAGVAAYFCCCAAGRAGGGRSPRDAE